MNVFGIAGHSGMGETTLLERLVPVLTARMACGPQPVRPRSGTATRCISTGCGLAASSLSAA